MDNTMDKKHPVSELMRSTIEKVHELVDTNVIVGQPINTPDGVTLIPISRVNFGFGSGGGDCEDIEELYRMIASGDLVPRTEVISFDEIPAGLDRLRQGGLTRRLVAVMD